MIRIDSNIAPEEEILKPTAFPDGTKLLKFDPARDEYTITWLYDNDEELFQLIALTKHLKNKGCKVWLNLPYVPNARMDRVKNKEEVFTLKYFAEVINWLGFEEVRIVNPHSTVSEALFDRVLVDFNCVYQDVKRVIETSLTKIDMLYYPDSGAQKRFGELLNGFNLPYMYGEKIRDWKTGEIKGLKINNPANVQCKTALIIDDIISYGGTVFYSALELQKLGIETIYVYATHCEDSIMDPIKGKLLKLDCIKNIFTTNSIFRGIGNHKIKIIRKF